MGLAFLMAVHIGLILAFTFFAFFTGGQAMFLLNTIVNLALRSIMDFAMGIVEKDAGCAD